MTEDLWSHALKFLDKYRLNDEDGDYNCDDVEDYDDAYMDGAQVVKMQCSTIMMERTRSNAQSMIMMMVMMLMMCTRSNADKYDIEELYEFADHTGILERHRQLLAKPFHENQVYINDHDLSGTSQNMSS